MNNILNLFLFILLLSCTKEADIAVSPYLGCGSPLVNPKLIASCQSIDTSTDMYICSSKHIGDYKLEDSSKLYMPQFCEEIGNILVYEDNKGNTLNFKLAFKSFFKTYGSQTKDYCMNDSSKYIINCINVEKATLLLKSETANLTLAIDICTIISRKDSVPNQIADILEVSRYIGPNYYTTELTSIINQRTYPISEFPRQEQSPSLIINDKKYFNVLSNDISSWPYPSFKYFYNIEFGLIAFKDLFGVTWSRKI